ncbi:hypothetical protein [Paramicrobacterium chengjingii]|uniref:Uncharacterized protein n=1 Tax=Paramicrobacterium chengjingii TaxID=2769067 RepID=A0ABX6YFK3_9MICO|nr:hypothetical protein [Microbacterium chengjingii]QPZ37588.1 hypothetical protein HCR76_12210 [Microbacterium chengjingii]
MGVGQGPVEVGIPYTGWPVRKDSDYEFGLTTHKLSNELVRQLLEWARFFNYTYDDENGWPSEEAKNYYVSTGEALTKRVRQELGPDFTVQRVPELE